MISIYDSIFILCILTLRIFLESVEGPVDEKIATIGAGL